MEKDAIQSPEPDGGYQHDYQSTSSPMKDESLINLEGEEDSSDTELDSLQRNSHKKKIFYNPGEYGPDDIFCQKCFKPFINLRGLWSHVSQIRHCRHFYGEASIIEMREKLSALPPVSPSTQALRIAQQREKSRDYFEKHRLKILKKRKEIFNASKDNYGDKDTQIQEELEFSHCKHCYKPFKNLRGLWSHIAQMIPCRKFYGEEALSGMKDGLTELYGTTKNPVVKRSTRKRKQNKEMFQQDPENPNEKGDANFIAEQENNPKVQRTEESQNLELNETQVQTGKAISKKHKVRKNKSSNDETKPSVKTEEKDNSTSNSKKLTPIPDPEKPFGTLNLQSMRGETDDGKPFWSIERQTSVLNVCQIDKNQTPGASKIDHTAVDELTTFPVDSKLSSLILSADDCDFVDAFVAMSLSNDGESVEIKYLLRRHDITLEGLRLLLHSVQCVLEVDLYNFLSDKTSPVLLSPPEQLPLLRNRFTKDILCANKEKPPVCDPLCLAPTKNFETHFISDEMLEDLPYHQLLYNPNLALCDMGCVGVQFRRPNEENIFLAPIFSVNMEHHWKHYTKIFYTILINWVGSKSLLTDLVHRLPCGITAKNQYFDAVRTECYNLVQQPRDVSVCEHCGEQYEFYKYLFSEKNKYKHHVESHKLTCKKCGQSFPNATVRIFHERTHRKNYVPCTKEGCKWVGRSDKSLQTHIRIFHTHELCDLCGKEFANSQSLALHMSSYHLPKKPNNWFCEVCGKGYSSKNILDKHVKRHFKENSLVNKWMHESPNEYKYECTKHNNCKKYFKTEAQFKRHMKTFATREYPTKCATQYRPDIDPSSKDFIRDVSMSMEEFQSNHILKKGAKKKKKDKEEQHTEEEREKTNTLKATTTPKKKKKGKTISGSEDGLPANPGSSDMVDLIVAAAIRNPEVIKESMTEVQKPAFVNHEYIPMNCDLVQQSLIQSKSVEPLSRRSSIASILPPAVQSPDLVLGTQDEKELKEEPEDRPQLIYRGSAPIVSFPSRPPHQIFHHLQQVQPNPGDMQQVNPHNLPEQGLPHWMAIAHHALYSNPGTQNNPGNGRQ